MRRRRGRVIDASSPTIRHSGLVDDFDGGVLVDFSELAELDVLDEGIRRAFALALGGPVGFVVEAALRARAFEHVVSAGSYRGSSMVVVIVLLVFAVMSMMGWVGDGRTRGFRMSRQLRVEKKGSPRDRVDYHVYEARAGDDGARRGPEGNAHFGAAHQRHATRSYRQR